MGISLEHKRVVKLIGNTQMQKAFALAIYIKSRCRRDSTVYNFNPHRIHKLVGISPNTFKKYYPLMVKMQLVHFSGKNNENLVFDHLKNRKHKQNNIYFENFCLGSYADIYKSLRSQIALCIQRRKNYVRHILQMTRNPKRNEYKEFHAANKKKRNLVRRGIIRNSEWRDYGISYQRIAKEVGCCVRTAQRVIAYAVDNGWCTKSHTWWRDKLPGVHFRPVDGYTFTTLNYGYVIQANTFTLCEAERPIPLPGKKYSGNQWWW